MTPTERAALRQAQRIVAAIEADILDRRGLKWELRQCDPDVRKQIRDAWCAIVLAHLKEADR